MKHLYKNQDEIKKSITKSNERPLKSKFNAGHVRDQVYCVKWGSKNRIFTSGENQNHFQMMSFWEKIVLY